MVLDVGQTMTSDGLRSSSNQVQRPVPVLPLVSRLPFLRCCHWLFTFYLISEHSHRSQWHRVFLSIANGSQVILSIANGILFGSQWERHGLLSRANGRRGSLLLVGWWSRAAETAHVFCCSWDEGGLCLKWLSYDGPTKPPLCPHSSFLSLLCIKAIFLLNFSCWSKKCSKPPFPVRWPIILYKSGFGFLYYFVKPNRLLTNETLVMFAERFHALLFMFDKWQSN